MDGTTPLVINRVGLIRGCQVNAAPIKTGWPDMMSPPLGYPTPGFPRLFMTDICTGSDHITLSKINDWSVTAGTFDPFYLFGASLKRYINNNTQATQTLSGVQTGVTYNISLSGDATVSFSGPASVVYSWGTNSQNMSDQTVSVDFTTDVPTSISIKLNNNADEVTGMSMTDPNGVEMLSNIDFVSVEEQFYDIEGWYVDSEDERIVPPSTLGYLQGFNDTQIFTIFE